MDTRIYICTHKQYTKPDSDLYHSLHVGRAISTDLGYEGDDTGDQISDRNRSFCELTGLYWIWKNVRCDIVGICHYRRYFIDDEDFLSKERIEALLEKDYDVILPTSSFTHYENTRDHYAHEHFSKDLDTLREILAELSPESLPAFDLTCSCNLMSAWNMLIAGKEIFDEYCGWLFPILFEAEKRIDISSYDTFQGRLFGYLSERLIRVFFMMHTYRIYEAEVRLTDPENIINLQKIIPPLERLMRLKIQDLLTIYRSGNYVNVVDILPQNIDFHGKLPVFVCWWQGFDHAPELVRVCRKSWQKNIPNDLAEIHEITLANYTDYITFPDWIMKRVQNETISLTMFSDILRMGLLYLYGGLWMDATCYLTSPLTEQILRNSNSFYTIRSDKPLWNGDIAEGNWSINFLKLPSKNLLAQFVLNSFYYYFIANERPVHYFMTDLLIRIAYTEYSDIHDMIDSCGQSQPSVLALQNLLSETFYDEDWNELTSDTTIFKLSYKHELSENDILGRETYWEHIRQLSGENR